MCCSLARHILCRGSQPFPSSDAMFCASPPSRLKPSATRHKSCQTNLVRHTKCKSQLTPSPACLHAGENADPNVSFFPAGVAGWFFSITRTELGRVCISMSSPPTMQEASTSCFFQALQKSTANERSHLLQELFTESARHGNG